MYPPPTPPLVTPMIGAFYFCSSKSNRFLTGILEGSLSRFLICTKLLAVIYFGTENNHTDWRVIFHIHLSQFACFLFLILIESI